MSYLQDNPAPMADGVNTTHPIYDSLKDMRQKCRDVVAGQDKIKSRGEAYLPRLEGQSNEQYKNYKNRALFFSIGAKSLQAVVGMASLKRPTFNAPEEMIKKYFNYTENVEFNEMFTKMCSEVALQNQCGAYVDWPTDGGDAYIVVVTSEQMINWDYDEDGNLTLVVVAESYFEKSGRYKKEIKIRYREFYLDDGVYTQTLYDENGAEVSSTVPSVLGQSLKSIPFFPFHSKGLGFTEEPPMLLDIANINISHYMTSADLEHGRHFTGLPTPIISGCDSKDPLHIGSNEFIVLPDKGAKATYLEFTGQGLKSLETALSEKQSMLAALSARLIDNSSKGSEATEAVKLRYLSETASLTTIVKTINVVLNLMYNVIATSLRHSPDSVNVVLDYDFLSAQLSPAEMASLFNAYLEGGIDINTLVYNLRKGLRLNPDSDDTAIAKAIEEHRKSLKDTSEK